MVKLHIKRGDESQFLYETSTDTSIDILLNDLIVIHNGRLKVQRICAGKYPIFSPSYFSELAVAKKAKKQFIGAIHFKRSSC